MPRPLRDILHHYRWIHLSVGVIGNAIFVAGSIFLLFEPLKRASMWLFIGGSAGMLVSAMGEIIVKWESREKYS